jgi:isopentenyldiphosphate isomerase
MINSQELLYCVDEFDCAIAPMPRDVVHRQGHWRRTAHVWVINHKGELLCQQRSMKKDLSPGKWEPAVAGHIGPEDNYFTGAVREVREETGLSVNPEDLELVKIYKDHDTREFRGVFYWKCEAEHHHVAKEDDEVEDYKFIPLTDLQKELSESSKDKWITHGYEEEIFKVLEAI